jgi:hypothetical protein
MQFKKRRKKNEFAILEISQATSDSQKKI